MEHLKFLKQTYQYLKKYNNNKFSFVISRGRYLNDVNNIIAAIAANKILKLNPIVISDKYKDKYDTFFKIFNFKNKIDIFSYKNFYFHPFIFFKSFCYFTFCLFNLNKEGFEWLIDKFNIKSVKVGDLIYDTYTRIDHRYLSPKIDLALCNIIFKACFRTFKLTKLIEKYRPQIIFIGTDGYAHNDGIIMRIALQKNIPVLEASSKYISKSKKFRIEYGFHHLRKIIDNKKFKIKKNLINKSFFLKTKKKINSSYTETYFLANQLKNIKSLKFKKLLQFIKKNNFAKIILVAPHAFSDAPHVNGNLIFKDFFSQFKETIDFIKKTKFKDNILWIIKKHPASFVFGEDKIFDDFIEIYLSKNIIRCPSNINTDQLIKICDNVITSRGSIGLEFACYGKYPILGGYAPYSHLGFTIDAKNKKSYFNTILNIAKITKLNKNQIFKARKISFILDTAAYREKLDPSIIAQDLKFMRNYNKGLLKNKFISDQNIFISNFLKKLNKTNLYNDPYYLSLEKYFKFKKYIL